MDYKSLTLDFMLIIVKYLLCLMIKVFIIHCTSTYFNSKYILELLVVQPFCDYYAKVSVFLLGLSAGGGKFSGGSPS